MNQLVLIAIVLSCTGTVVALVLFSLAAVLVRCLLNKRLSRVTTARTSSEGGCSIRGIEGLPPAAVLFAGFCAGPAEELSGDGDVCFMFAGVEGDVLLDTMPHGLGGRALAVLYAVLADCFQRFRGRVVACRDASFMVAFARADSAIGAAVEAQQRLLYAQWPQSLLVYDRAFAEEVDPTTGVVVQRGLRLAVGIHVGRCNCLRLASSPVITYRGPTVRKAYRVAANAYGGQILVTTSAFKQARPLLENNPEIALQWLGTIPHAETVWQVLPVTLAARSFPPLLSDHTIWIFPGLLDSILRCGETEEDLRTYHREVNSVPEGRQDQSLNHATVSIALPEGGGAQDAATQSHSTAVPEVGEQQNTTKKPPAGPSIVECTVLPAVKREASRSLSLSADSADSVATRQAWPPTPGGSLSSPGQSRLNRHKSKSGILRHALAWERYTAEPSTKGEGSVFVRTYHGTYLSLSPRGSVACVAGPPDENESFEVQAVDEGRRVALKTRHGTWLSVDRWLRPKQAPHCKPWEFFAVVSILVPANNNDMREHVAAHLAEQNARAAAAERDGDLKLALTISQTALRQLASSNLAHLDGPFNELVEQCRHRIERIFAQVPSRPLSQEQQPVQQQQQQQTPGAAEQEALKLTCAVCFLEFESGDGPHTPFLLHCGHTFCHSCLLSIPRVIGSPDVMLCPTCRSPHNVARDPPKKNYQLDEVLEAIGRSKAV
eukprot:m51a1_g6410 putative serine threonine protein (719) ;mRNA; f:264435-267842